MDEKSVLSGIIQYGKEAYLDVNDLVDSNSFQDEFHSYLYNILSRLCEQDIKIDIPSILSTAQLLNYNTFIKGPDDKKYLQSLFKFPIALENVRRFAGKLFKLKIRDNLKNELSEIDNKLDLVSGEETLNDILNIAEERIFNFSASIGQTGENEPTHISTNLDSYIQQLIENPVSQIGIPTGFPQYDLSIGGGLRKGCFNLIGARPKVGKSTIADNVAIHTAVNLEIPTLLLDTEMEINDHWNRIIANLGSIEVNQVGCGIFSKDPIKKQEVSNISVKLAQSKYFYKNISGKPFTEVLSIIRRWLMKHVGHQNDCVVIYDYFKLPESESKSNHQEYQLIGFQSAKLHDFAVKHNIPVLAFVQLNRTGIDKETTDIVSQSDRLLWNCASFSIFKKKTQDEIKEDGIQNGNRKLVPLISRYGEEWDFDNYINMEMQGKYARVTELGTKSGCQGFKLN